VSDQHKQQWTILAIREKKQRPFSKFNENKRNKSGARSYRRMYRKQDSSRKLRKFIYKGKVFFKKFPPILVNFKIFPVRSYAHAGRFYISDQLLHHLTPSGYFIILNNRIKTS
jgi:hypothetical protein